ncbi:MAG: Omp28-related outer membrane protein [Bacteroidales bacterium]|nr:Omp28-related outer membrane protein [Lentimicrobiaceae bacterium]MDD5694990.1 Omp28-related outer membrane protein [Bacteroidales bacterium]
MDSLVLAGHSAAIIENHGGDTYENEYSAARNAYYNLSAYPTAKFDGVETYVDGPQCPEPYGNYAIYVPIVSGRLDIASPVKLTTEFYPAGVDTYHLSAHVIKVGAIDNPNLYLRAYITESHIAQTWYCLEEVNFVNRRMVPDAQGTAIDFSGNNEVSVNLDFTIDPSWNKEQLEFVVFVQNDNGKEVLQTVKTPFPLYARDALLSGLENVPTASCTGILQPAFTIINNGSEPLTSLMVHYQINSDPLVSWEWEGEIPYTGSATVEIDPITFTPQGNNTFLLYGTEPNGNTDQNLLNDTLTDSFISAWTCTTYKVALTLQTDDNPGETTYGVYNSLGEKIYSGGPFEAANSIVKDTLELMSTDCYRFVMLDAGCDGLTGGGYYSLKEAKSGGHMIYFHGPDAEFTCEKTTEFQIEWVGLNDHPSIEPVTLCPNPFSMNTELRLNLPKADKVSVDVYNIIGKQVFSLEMGLLPAGDHPLLLSRDQLSRGLNLVRVSIGNRVYTEKLVLE